MFIQVIQGRVADADGLRESVERWLDTIAPGAPGWLGTTGGVTAEGQAIAVVRFESAEAARRNSDSPEQTQWWAEASKYFAGEVTFHDCPEVIAFLDGGSDDAGFVQVIQGRATNVDRLRELMTRSTDALREFRPEIIGGVLALHGDSDGGFTQVAYFTSEAAAREGERKQPPPQVQETNQELMAMFADASFFDLTNPWMFSRR